MISWLVGAQDAGYAHELVQDVAVWLANRVQFTTNGHNAYIQAVEMALGDDVDYAMLVKLYGGTTVALDRCGPANCIGAHKERIDRNPGPKHTGTSYVER